MRRGSRRVGAGLGLLLLGWVSALVLVAAPAGAHATVVGSTPADGARLERAPAEVSVTFDESVRVDGGGYLRVVDGGGIRVDSGAATIAGRTVTVRLRSGVGTGSYLASFRVVSADSHVVAGTVRFAVGDAPLPTAGTAASASPVRGWLNLARWVDYAGLAVLGGLWLLLVAGPAVSAARRVPRLLWTGWAMTVGGVGAELLLHGPDLAGRGVSAVFDADLLRGTLGSTFGVAHCVRLVGLAGLAVVLDQRLARARPPGWLPEAGGALAVLTAVTYPIAGHADAASPRWLAIAVDAGHVLAMAGWLGGLVLLGVLLGPGGDDVGDLARRFSAAAPWLIGGLAATGVYQAWRETAGWSAVVDTTYGRLVLLKVAALLLVVLVAAGSRRLVRRSTGFGPGPGLWRLVAVEAVFAVAALGAAAVLVSQPPGRQVVAVRTARQPVSGTAQIGHGSTATITVRPRRHGAVSITVDVHGRAPTTLTLTARQTEQRIGPVPIVLRDGVATGVGLPVAGPWRFQLAATWSEFDTVVAEVVISLV